MSGEGWWLEGGDRYFSVRDLIFENILHTDLFGEECSFYFLTGMAGSFLGHTVSLCTSSLCSLSTCDT